jgi:ABC-type amino acid transport substrate-binding protein
MRALAPVLLALAWACAAPDPAPRERVLVASDLDNAPFAFVDPSGEPAGRDVEMMRALAERAGLALAWQRLPFEELLPAVEAGRVDVVCATLGVTPERAERVAFSRPYFRTRIVVVARRGAGQPTRLDELSGRRVAAGRGTTSERAVQSALPLASLASEAKSEGTTEQRLRTGLIDAAVMDEPAAAALVARSQGALVILEPALADENYALALPRDRPDLLEALDRALAELEADGGLARLDAAHGLGP